MNQRVYFLRQMPIEKKKLAVTHKIHTLIANHEADTPKTNGWVVIFNASQQIFGSMIFLAHPSVPIN